MMCYLCRREEGAEAREEGSQERQVEEGNWRRRRRRRRGRRERERGEGVTTGRGGPSLDRAASLSDDVLTYSLSIHDLHPLYIHTHSLSIHDLHPLYIHTLSMHDLRTSTVHATQNCSKLHDMYCIVTIATQNLIALCITIIIGIIIIPIIIVIRT